MVGQRALRGAAAGGETGGLPMGIPFAVHLPLFETASIQSSGGGRATRRAGGTRTSREAVAGTPIASGPIENAAPRLPGRSRPRRSGARTDVGRRSARQIRAGSAARFLPAGLGLSRRASVDEEPHPVSERAAEPETEPASLRHDDRAGQAPGSVRQHGADRAGLPRRRKPEAGQQTPGAANVGGNERSVVRGGERAKTHDRHARRNSPQGRCCCRAEGGRGCTPGSSGRCHTSYQRPVQTGR